MAFRGLETVRFAPLPQGDDYGEEIVPAFREDILRAGAALRGWHKLEDALVDEFAETGGENPFRNAQSTLELAELPRAIEGLPDEQEGPPIAYRIKGTSDGTIRCRKAGAVNQMNL